jgi:hypothetical protein
VLEVENEIPERAKVQAIENLRSTKREKKKKLDLVLL